MRGYPFFRYVVALLIGIFAAEAWPDLSPLWPGLLGLICFVFYIYRHFWLERQVAKPMDIPLSLAQMGTIAALGWGLLYANAPAHRPNNLLHLPEPPEAYEAVVTNLPEARAKTYKVELELRRVRWGAGEASGRYQPVSGRVVAYLDRGDAAADSLAPTPPPRYGEVWLVLGPPALVDPPRNPAEFDYRRFLGRRGIYHQQYLRPWQRRVIGYDPPNRLTAVAYQVNRWADSLLTAKVGSRAEYSIVNAMLLGVRDDLDTQQYQTYAAAGAVHILSVSGMHIGILFLVLTNLLALVAKGRESSWPVVLLKLALLWFFALMTGLSAPVMRSAVMFTYLLLAEALHKKQTLMNTLGASAALVLVWDPYAAFSMGFQLSYLSILGIAAWAPTFNRLWKPKGRVATWLWEASMVALAAQLVALPLSIYYFHAFPAYFLVANPLVIILSMALVPLAMATVILGWIPVLGDVLGWALQLVAKLMNVSVEAVGTLPGASLDGYWLSQTGLWLGYAGLALAGMAVLTRQRTYVLLAAVVTVLLAGITVYEVRQQTAQRRLVVHYMPRQTALSLTTGQQTYLLTDADFAIKPRLYEYHLKNAFGSWGVRQVRSGNLRIDTIPGLPTYRHAPDKALLVWQGRSILLINRFDTFRRWQLPRVIDYVVLRRNALRDWQQLDNRLVARTLIFDDSNAPLKVDSLLKNKPPTLASRVYSVQKDGAFVAEW